MYRRNDRAQLEFPDFYLPFSGHLDPENRWVALARLVPWDLADEIYLADLCADSGAPIVPSRVALGALLIKERLGLTDRDEAREKTHEIIDERHRPLVGMQPRPRTYRVKARRQFIAFVKRKKPTQRDSAVYRPKSADYTAQRRLCRILHRRSTGDKVLA